MMKSWRRVNVRINCRLGQIAALVSGATQSDNFHRLNRLNNRLDILTEVRQRRCNTNLVIRVWLFNRERFEVLDLALDELLGREVFIRDNFVDAMLGAAEKRVAYFAVID